MGSNGNGQGGNGLAKQGGSKELPQAFYDNQFKPGQSGNPAGRKKQRTVSEILRDRLQELATTSPVATEICKKLNIDASNKTLADVLAETLLLSSFQNRPRIISELLDRAEGKVVQKVEATVHPEYVIEFDHRA